MAKVAYIPYNETMAAIFSALGITLSPSDFGGQQGWDAEAFSTACADAWDALVDLNEFDYNGDGIDDWDAAEALIHGNFTVMYWSTESGQMPT